MIIVNIRYILYFIIFIHFFYGQGSELKCRKTELCYYENNNSTYLNLYECIYTFTE